MNITTKLIHKNYDCIVVYNLTFINEVINAKMKYNLVGKSKNTTGVWRLKTI